MIDALATAALTGVGVDRIVRGDPVERGLYLRVTRRAGELRVQLLKAQASHNAEQVSHLFKKR